VAGCAQKLISSSYSLIATNTTTNHLSTYFVDNHFTVRDLSYTPANKQTNEYKQGDLNDHIAMAVQGSARFAETRFAENPNPNPKP